MGPSVLIHACVSPTLRSPSPESVEQLGVARKLAMRARRFITAIRVSVAVVWVTLTLPLEMFAV